jgi:hypothetical protein
MRLNKKVFKSNNLKNEYIDYSEFLHTSNRSYSVNHKIRNGIGKVFSSFSIGLSNSETKFLVLWGNNLYYTFGIRLTQYELNIIKLPKNIRSIMVGLLLSDGYKSYSARSKNGRTFYAYIFDV